jgi:hypothetical protein
MSDSIALQQRRRSAVRVSWLSFALAARGFLDRLRRRVADGPRDRGDVPGWVLVTIMTAGLVVALWAIAGQRLGQMFTDALDQVAGGPK